MALNPFVPGLLLLALSACGYKSAVTRLEPPNPALTKDEQAAARATERAQVEAGLKIPTDARPQRVDDLTVKLDVRLDDPFSLPPEGTSGGKPIPFPGDPAVRPPRPDQTAPER